jgi:IS5 family transposase
MRTKRTHQMSIYETFAEHEIGRELKAISSWLDRHINLLEWAEQYIQRKGIKDTGLYRSRSACG